MRRGTYSKECTSLVRFRLTAEERAFTEEQADHASMTLSEFVRRRALGKRLVSRYDTQVMNEVRRLGGLMKHLASLYPAQRKEHGEVRSEVIALLRTLR